MMELFIFRTDIANANKAAKLEKVFSGFACVKSWTIDVEDIDKVLKVHTDPILRQIEIQSVVRKSGFLCEELA